MLSYEECGPRDGEVLFFLHGWPDSGRLWEKQVAYFKDRYRCIVVNLPNADSTASAARSTDFPSLIAETGAIINSVLRSHQRQKLTLIGHDWGAYLAYWLATEYPEHLKAIVTLDVGAHLKPQGFTHACFVCAYQWWLAAAFLIGGRLPVMGNWMTQKFANIAGVRHIDRVESSQNFYYLKFWLGVFSRRRRDYLLADYRPNLPSLYLYGTRKPFMFHTPKWLEVVTQTPHGRVVPIDGGHWFLLRRSNVVNTEIGRWLEEVIPSS